MVEVAIDLAAWSAVAALAFSVPAVVIAILSYRGQRATDRRQAASELQQRESERQSKELVVLIEVLRDFRTAEFQGHREFLRGLRDYKVSDRQILTDDEMSHVRPLLQYYDNVGMLVKRGIASELMVDYLGIPAQQAWWKLERFVREVEARQCAYMGNFQNLVERANERYGMYADVYYFKTPTQAASPMPTIR